MTDNSAVPLIVFSPQREPSEFINSLMRKAGEPVHCTWIPAVRDLGEALEQLNPELLVCAYVSESEAKQAATVRDQLAPQVPMLLVRPQISEGGAVRLQIYQEVSSVQDTTNPAGIITNKRAVESTVLVDDGQIVVIGGLIQDSVKDSVEKIPGLGDIPLIGGLFRYNTRSRSKTNLMVFLRPTLMRSAQSLNSLSNNRYDYILGEQLKARLPPILAVPDYGVSTLPPRENAPPEAPPGIVAPK